MSVATRCATNKRSSSKCLSRLDVRLIRGRVQIMGHRLIAMPFFVEMTNMLLYHFYFLKDEYFEIFNDPYLMGNHEKNAYVLHNRPFFFSVKDRTTGLFWMIPVSSKTSKYERIYNHKIKRNGRCDTIYFANFLGYRKAFLLQNMCPVSEHFIENIYVDSHHKPVALDRKTASELVLRLLMFWICINEDTI